MNRKLTILAICIGVLALGYVFASAWWVQRLVPASTFDGTFERVGKIGLPQGWSFVPDSELGVSFEVSIDSEQKSQGRNALRISTEQSTPKVGCRSVRVPVVVGKTYDINIDIRSDGRGKIQAKRIVQDATGKSHLRSNVLPINKGSGEWMSAKETLTIAEGEASITLLILIDGPATFWIDDVRIEEAEADASTRGSNESNDAPEEEPKS